MKINRIELINQLEAVLPGLSEKGEIEQSSCVVFKDKRIYTYNDEITCSIATELDINGAVQASPLITLLKKLKEDELNLSIDKGQLLIKGKNRKAGIIMDNEIVLPIGIIDEPKKWKKLPEEFSIGVNMTRQCVSKDESRFALTCIHITPDYIEATDSYQACVYKLAMKIKKPIFIRGDSVRYLKQMNPIRFGETKSWIQFKNKNGLTLCCRRYDEEFPDLDSIMNFKGTPTTLPKDIEETIKRAEIFSSQSTSNNNVSISLTKNSLLITGEGVHGWIKEKKKIKYQGKDLTFSISPDLFLNIAK